MLGKSYSPICFKLQHFAAYAPEFDTTNIINSIGTDETDVFSLKQLFLNFSTSIYTAGVDVCDMSLNCSQYISNRPLIASLTDYAKFSETVVDRELYTYLGDDATGNIEDIAISSLASLVDAIEYCALDWLGEEFYPWSALNANAGFDEIIFGEGEVGFKKELISKNFDVGCTPTDGALAASNEGFMSQDFLFVFGSVDHKLLGLYNFAEDTFSYRSDYRGKVSTDNLKYFGWVDEMMSWSDGGSLDWYDVYAADPEMRDFISMLKSGPSGDTFPIDMTSLRDAELHYLSQAGTSRIFIPRPFVASPMYNALGTPWFLDYVHLSSWFFFMAMFVLVMWINLVWSIFAKHIESRQPMRETRGFSRAQTGDSITAVLPLTWSITMLMHASTHSVNFDENTSGTIFTLTVIAYQWGWNYYFPRDIVEMCWNAPKQVGHGGTSYSQDHNYYDRLLNYTRQSMVTKFANEFRSASKAGKNIAPNIFSLFVKPSFVTSNFSGILPLFFSNTTFNSYAGTALSDTTAAGRKLNLVPSETINSRLVELLDEGGISVSSGFDKQISSKFVGTPSYSAATRLVNFNGGNVDAKSQTAVREFAQHTLGTTGLRAGATPHTLLAADYVAGFSRFVVKEDMLRYRLSDALRSKQTSVLSSNRLFLIYKNYVSLFTDASSTVTVTAANSTLDPFGSVFFFHNLTALRDCTTFMLRGAQVNDMQGNTSLNSLSAEYDASLFGHYGISVNNVGAGFWPLFFNSERYLLGENSAYASNVNSDIALFSNWCTTLLPQMPANSPSTQAFSFWWLSSHLYSSEKALICGGALAGSNVAVSGVEQYLPSLFSASTSSLMQNYLNYSYAAPLTTSLITLSNTRNWLNTSFASQFFTFTSPDTSFLFYFNSLLTYEDFGLNFSPSIKELTSRMSSYASYADNLHLAAFQSTHGNISTAAAGNVFNFIFFDTAFREMLSQIQLVPQVNALSKVGLTGVSSQLINQQQSFLSQNTSSSELSVANPAPSYSQVQSGLFFFSRVNSLSSKLATSVSSVISSSANTPSRGISQYSPIATLTDMRMQSNLYGSANAQYVDLLNFNPTASFSGTSSLAGNGAAWDTYFLNIGSSNGNTNLFAHTATLTQEALLCPGILATLPKTGDFGFCNPAVSTILSLHTQAGNLSWLSIASILDIQTPLTGATPVIPAVYTREYTGIVDCLQFNATSVGDFLTPASHVRATTVNTANPIDVSSVPDWYGSVDSSKPVRLNSKLQDPALFCFKLEDFPSSRIKFSQKLLFDWSMSWSSQVQVFGLPLYKMYRGGLARKVNCTFWASSSSVNASTLQQLIWSGENTSWYQPFKNFKESRLFVPKLLMRVNAAGVTASNIGILPVLDKETIAFIKNNLVILPSPHEEPDINFVYQYWTPEINTTRRADHASRFVTTWNLFFAKQDNLLGQNNSAGSAVVDSTRRITNSFYLMNQGLMEHSSHTAKNMTATIVDATTDSRLMQNTAAQAIVNSLFYFGSIAAVNGAVTSGSWTSTQSALASADYTWGDDCMLPTQACTMRVLANQLLWHNFWLYSSTQPDYKLSDVRSHTSGSSNNYLLTKLVLLSSAKDRELLRIQRSSSSFTPDLGNTQLLSNKLKFFVNAALVSQPATYRSVTLGGVASLKPEVLTNLLTNLASNLTKIRARSAYEFTRCDVGSMKRLRVTKGICLPADYPIHVICGSKDVVHSWAIPGLGIKIDCIPGYNSHRRVMFRWRGIYWGQCMEVCGRYHHWMPILIRIVHRDIFLSWCLIYLRALNSRSLTASQSKQNSLTVLTWLHSGSNELALQDLAGSLSHKFSDFSDFQSSLYESLYKNF